MYRLGDTVGKKSRNNNNRRSDDTFDISSDSELLRRFIQNKPANHPPTLHLNPPKFQLRQIEDRRAFHPKPFTQPAGTLKRSAARLVVPKAKTSPRASLPHQVAFEAPKHVLICVRRKQRREILFAKRKTRAGAASRKHRNQWSSIKC